MKKYIREILNDLKLAPRQKQPEPVVAEDLDNQILSSNPAQRLRQLDRQAQKSEERQTLG
jgi:hypothetical protein